MLRWFLTELPEHILFCIKIRITSPLIWQWARDAYFFSYEGLLIAGCRTRDFTIQPSYFVIWKERLIGDAR